MTCATCPKYQPRKCWETGLTEDEVTCFGDKSRCTASRPEQFTPTFSQIVSAYKEFTDKDNDRIRPITAAKNILALQNVFRHSALTPDSKITDLTEEEWENIVLDAASSVSKTSIKSFAEKVRALFSEKAAKYYRLKYGWELPQFGHVKYTSAIKPWMTLSRTDRQKIRDYQFALYHLADPRKYLCVTAAWERGQRKCDALRNHWSQIREIDGSVWWDYTSVKNGKSSHWPVDPDTFRMLKNAHRRLDSLSVHRLGKFPDSYLRVREFSRDEHATSAIWDSCCDDLRNIIGWSGSKAMHNLRKDACDTIYQVLGIDECEEFSTDSAKTLKLHYVAKKLVRADIPSIGKMIV